MRNHFAFTKLELVVAVAVISILAAVVMPQFYRLTMRAEAMNVQGVIGSLRSALSFKMAQALSQGDDMAALAYGGEKPLNPMHDLFEERPDKYLGVIGKSAQRGSWYDDRNSHELVYVVRNDNIVDGISGSPKRLRWRLNVVYVYGDGQPKKKQVLGLALQPATPHRWLEE